MPRRPRFLASSALAAAALVGAMVANVQDSAAAAAAVPAAAQSSARERGEQIMNASCQDCHDLRKIQVQAMDAEGWTRTINSMVEQGAMVSKEDLPVLVDYLVQHHGPIPDGQGKAVILNICTMCHDLQRIKLGRRSPEEWEETLITMLNEGAPLSDEQFALAHHYLSRNFGID